VDDRRDRAPAADDHGASSRPCAAR
jgi:hypothetical protein